jgi:acyl-CoA reductase-like NAD-dependent aldehyde dehydrogenase
MDDREIKTGNVSVNHFSEGDLTTPFGGFRQSGFGGKDKSVFAHHQYQNQKTIYVLPFFFLPFFFMVIIIIIIIIAYL